MKKWIIGSILILSILLPVCFSQGQQESLRSGELYDSATELFSKGKYDEAIGGFSKLIQSFPTSKLVPYSQYMMGQCYLKMERYGEALREFERYLRIYPDGDRAKEAEKGVQVSKKKLEEKGLPPSLQPTFSKDEERKILQEEPKKAEVISGAEVKGVKRRICVQVFDFDGKNLEEVEKRVREVKKAGVNTVILRVFQNKGGRVYRFAKPQHTEGVYFKTEYAPVVDDILGKVAEIVHRNGLDLFAWITTRYANYGGEDPPEYRCKSYNFETKKMEVARGFNLFHPDVVKRLEGLFRDLGRYPIDGILFQDDLILKHNEDFSADANKAFLKEFGYSPHPDMFYIDPYPSESGKYYVKAYTDRFWSWAKWKNRWLMNLAKRLMEAARESNPNLQFGINLYYEAVLNHSNGVAWFSQTLSEALEKNFDYYAVMAYHRQTMKELNMEERKAIELMAEVAGRAVKSVGDPAKVLMKMQILDWKSYEVLPKKEVEEILTGILNHGEVSLAFVPYIGQFPLHSLKEKWAASK
jgi:hypothetical protein